MRVALICTDKANHLQMRIDTRAAHRAYLEASPQVEQAGPLLDAAGDMCGSLIVLSVESLAEAEAWAAADPYAQAGLFSDTRMQAWTRVIG